MANYTIFLKSGEQVHGFGSLQKCLSSVRAMKFSEYPIEVTKVIYDGNEI